MKKTTPKTMQVVINDCYGGFGLSRAGLSRYAALKGKKAYFFASDGPLYGRYVPLVEGTPAQTLEFWVCFTIPNPNEILHIGSGEWRSMTPAQGEAENKLYNKHTISVREIARTDKYLIQVIKELGDEANSRFSKLKIISIPKGVKYRIEEYDGLEHVAEGRTWQ